MEYKLSDLEKAAIADQEEKKIKTRANYKLARELGFSSYEAKILCQKTETIIRKLAEERKANA